jgi:outer membrane protein OmpA-like peptidoglycan-associated protein
MRCCQNTIHDNIHPLSVKDFLLKRYDALSTILNVKFMLVNLKTLIIFLRTTTMVQFSSKILAVSALMAMAVPAFAHDSKDVVLDKNGKHVLDVRKNCVRTKWDASSDKCADAVVEKPVTGDLRKEELVVYFPFDSSTVTMAEKQKLDRVADILKGTNGKVKSSIVGYTDRIGTDAYNVKLSERRANAVSHYLNNRGYLDTTTAEVRGLGKTDSQSRCEGIKKRAKLIECLWKDRRVEIELQY